MNRALLVGTGPRWWRSLQVWHHMAKAHYVVDYLNDGLGPARTICWDCDRIWWWGDGPEGKL